MQGYTFMIERSYTVAHIKAVKENKMLLVFLTKKECKYCNKELMKILQNKKLDKAIKNRALFVIIIKNQKESYPIEMLYSTRYPTLFLLDKYELSHCKALRGEMNPKQILDCLMKK